MTFTASRTLIAAHRGGAGLWPENSMTAFRSVLALPVDQIETDIHLSADGEPFILHDAKLDRTTEATGVASKLPFPDLAHIRLKGTTADTIPHLDELLALMRPTDLTLRLELKRNAFSEADPNLLPRAVKSLETHAMLTRTVFTSFDRRYLAQARSTGLTNPLIWLIAPSEQERHGIDGILDMAQAAELPEIAPRINLADADVAAATRARNIRFGCYAVNDGPAIDKALALNASVFTTDRPDLALAAREKSCDPN